VTLADYEPTVSLVVAAAVGLLIGLERERPVEDEGGGPPRRHPAGARTFTLASLTGGVAALLAASYGVWILVGTIVAVGALAVAAYRSAAKEPSTGITTELALLGATLLGAFICSPDLPLSIESRLSVGFSLGVAIMALLSAKPLFRRFASRLLQEDVVATTKFLIVAGIVLPLLPDEGLGPWQALNPRHIGWMVVLVAAISFVGYVAARILGRRGLWLTGVVGGLVSSTAVTVAFSGRCKRQPALRPVLAAGIVAACTIMFPRIGLEAAVVAPALGRHLAGAVAVASVVGAAGTAWLLARGPGTGEGEAEPVHLSNPFELGGALWFGALFAGINLAVRAADAYLGAGGTYLASAVAGLTDVDAITLSAASLLREGTVGVGRAAAMVGVGAASNTVVKIGLSFVLGDRRLGAVVAAWTGLSLLAGAVVLTVAGVG